MKQRLSPKGFTLIELLVVISIIAILASFAIPGAMSVMVKANQMKSLNNVKNIYLGCKTWANDHDGAFPYAKSQDSVTNGTPPDAQYSNDAYANLLPNYVPQEKLFWISKSKWCNIAPPDEKLGDGVSLAGGECGYAYVNKLNDSSNPSFPLVAEAPRDQEGTYSTDAAQPGGVWKGQAAVVCRVDGSVKIEMVNKNTLQIMVQIGQGSPQNIFSKGFTSTDPNIPSWLSTDNRLLLPMPATTN